MIKIWICFLFSLASTTVIGKPEKKFDMGLLNEETSKLICFITQINKKTSAIEHYSATLKEHFEGFHSFTHNIVNDLIRVRSEIRHSFDNLTETVIGEMAKKYTILNRLRSIKVIDLVTLASTIVHSLDETYNQLLILREFSNQSTYYKNLVAKNFPPKQLPLIKEHITKLSSSLKKSILKSKVIHDHTVTEQEFFKQLIASPVYFSQLIDRSALTLCALHNIIINQMEYIYDLQHSIIKLEKEPTSILDDIHEKTLTLASKLQSTQQLVTRMLKLVLTLTLNSVNLINNGLALIQASQCFFSITLSQEQEIETEILQLIRALDIKK